MVLQVVFRLFHVLGTQEGRLVDEPVVADAGDAHTEGETLDGLLVAQREDLLEGRIGDLDDRGRLG